MTIRSTLFALLLLAFLACSGGDNNQVQPGPVPSQIAATGGAQQSGAPGSALPLPLSVLVTDASGNPVAGVEVTWSVLTGGGTVSPASSTTNSDGVATTQYTLGPAEGEQLAQGQSAGLQGSPVVFSETATVAPRLLHRRRASTSRLSEEATTSASGTARTSGFMAATPIPVPGAACPARDGSGTCSRSGRLMQPERRPWWTRSRSPTSTRLVMSK